MSSKNANNYFWSLKGILLLQEPSFRNKIIDFHIKERRIRKLIFSKIYLEFFLQLNNLKIMIFKILVIVKGLAKSRRIFKVLNVHLFLKNNWNLIFRQNLIHP
jgi:hypothetical protein